MYSDNASLVYFLFQVAGVVGNLVQVIMSLLFYVQVYVGDNIDTAYYYLMCLLSPCAFSMAIDKVSNFCVCNTPKLLVDLPLKRQNSLSRPHSYITKVLQGKTLSRPIFTIYTKEL